MVSSSLISPLQPNQTPARSRSAAFTATVRPPAEVPARVGDGDAIGNDDQAHSQASSQLDDSRVAVLMIPAIE